MDGGVLVASHLSALFASASPISVPTAQTDLSPPLLAASGASTPGHAAYASLFHAHQTGTILLRVTHAATFVELVPLARDIPSLQFDFPSPLLPCPDLLIWNDKELHLLAVTVRGSLFRIVIPLQQGAQLWHPHKHSVREYVIRNMPENASALVQVQGVDCVVVSLPYGALLRLETEFLGESGLSDHWKETKIQPHSFLTSIASLLPTLQGGPQGSSDIISMATFPQPTDIVEVWTLSRDRTLRLWSGRSGVVAETPLASIIPGRSVGGAPGSQPGSVKNSLLLPPEPKKSLAVFPKLDNSAPYQILTDEASGAQSTAEYSASTFQDLGGVVPCVLAFIPTETSASSGGYFHLFESSHHDLRSVNYFECSSRSVHCHLQDFRVIGSNLYIVWEKQGQSMAEKTALSFDRTGLVDVTWSTASYAEEVELTPAYLDELLLAPGSMTHRLFEAILRPGLFSPLTLQTAIYHYADACRSLPAPHPPQLLTTYGNVNEQIAAVVGCTVQLTRDPSTGSPQREKYWSALRRDWEGFIARCREIERNGRWPLAIGVDPAEGVLVVERERLASVAAEDFPLRLHRQLLTAVPVDPSLALLDILWTLRDKIGKRQMLFVEERLVDVLHQEIAFPYADIVQDLAKRLNFRKELDEGFESWIGGRLESIHDVPGAISSVINVICSTDLAVKREQDDGDSRLPPADPEWPRALASAYIGISVQSRYELCLCLVTWLFFLADEVAQWDTSTLAEVFVMFRAIAMLRDVARHPAAIRADTADQGVDDDVVARMRNMHVSSKNSGFSSTHSIIHQLIAQYGVPSSGVTATAHLLLDVTGLLDSESPSHATKAEVLFCEKLRLLGCREAARDTLEWLPGTPGVSYVSGRLWLDEGRHDDAIHVLENVAGSFGPHSALTSEDREALAAVLPNAAFFRTTFEFHLHVAGLFKAASVLSYEVLFSQRALSLAPKGADTSTLWQAIIRGLTELGLWDDAYTALVSAPYDKIKRECVSHLMYRMCEDTAVDKFMAFNFTGLADEVEDALSFKARNADPRVRPFYSLILYTWYVSRGDYRNAALTMYQRARKLGSLLGDPEDFFQLADIQLDALALSMNALALVDRKDAWIVLPVTGESEHEPRKRRKLSRHIPEGQYAFGKRDAEVVELADMEYEYALLAARLWVIRRDPTLLGAGEPLLSPPSIVDRLIQANRFTMAMVTAQSLKVDMTDLFGRLTTQCLRLSRNPEAVIGEDTSDWLLTDKVSSWPGTPADRGWRYLRQSLERYDGLDTDYQYTKVTLETLLQYSHGSSPPPWIIQSLETHHPEYLIRTCLRYEDLEAALGHTLALIAKTDDALAREEPRAAGVTWLPYNLIDQVLFAADAQERLSTKGQALYAQLRTQLTHRTKKMKKLTDSCR